MDSNSVNLPAGYQIEPPNVPEGYQIETPTSALGAAGTGALNAIPFAEKGVAAGEQALEGGKYEDYLHQLDALVEQGKEEHPIAHAAGELTGAVAPFAIPGVGEALGAESLAGRAAVGAGIGALQGASNTRADLTSPQGISDIAKGAGVGAVVNPAVGGLTDLANKGLSSASEGLENFANEKAVQAAGLRPGSLGLPEDEIQELGQKMRDWDLVNGPIQDKVVKSQVLLNKAGQTINEIGANALPLEDSTPFTDALQKEAEKSSQFFGTEGNQDLNTYRQGIANIQNNGKDFQSLQALKSAYGEKAFDANGQVANPAAAKVYGQIKDAMKSIVDGAPEDYQKAMDQYADLKSINGGLMKQLQQTQATGAQTKGFGLAGKLTGMVTGEHPMAQLGAAAALAPEHPFMALGALTPMVTNPALMSKLAGGAANIAGKGISSAVAPAVANAITNQNPAPKIPPQYAPVFQRAVQGITDPAEKQKQMTITDFVLQSRDPNYAKAKQDQEGL